VAGAEGDIELEPGEAVITHAHAAFRGGFAASMRGTFTLGSGRYREKEHFHWQEVATAGGFPEVPADMIVAVTETTLLVGKPTFWGGRPASFLTSFPLERIDRGVTVRRGLITSAAFALTNGHIVEIESMNGRRLRRLVETVNELAGSG
jgi:hypothetical protein